MNSDLVKIITEYLCFSYTGAKIAKSISPFSRKIANDIIKTKIMTLIENHSKKAITWCFLLDDIADLQTKIQKILNKKTENKIRELFCDKSVTRFSVTCNSVWIECGYGEKIVVNGHDRFAMVVNIEGVGMPFRFYKDNIDYIYPPTIYDFTCIKRIFGDPIIFSKKFIEIFSAHCETGDLMYEIMKIFKKLN